MTSEKLALIEFRSGNDRPEWMKDAVTITTTVGLDWMDRLRVLFHGFLEVETCTATENVVGRTETRSCLHIRPIFRKRRALTFGGCEAASSPGAPDAR